MDSDNTKIVGRIVGRKTVKEDVNICSSSIIVDKLTGACIASEYPIPCKRCNGTEMLICPDPTGNLVSCYNVNCMREDSMDSAQDADRLRKKKREENISAFKIKPRI